MWIIHCRYYPAYDGLRVSSWAGLMAVVNFLNDLGWGCEVEEVFDCS